MCGTDIFLGIIALFFPPIAVWVKRGICSADALINLALCCLGVLPGLLHAWYIIYTYPEPTYDEVAQDPEGNRVAYYYVQEGGSAPSRQAQAGNGGAAGAGRGYGTVGSAPSQQFPAQQQLQGTVPQGQYKAPEVPPTYQEAIGGNHKVQTQD